MKKGKKLTIYTLVLFFITLNISIGLTQEATLTGTVYSNQGEPLAGVKVKLKKLHFETTTDKNGQYTIIGIPYDTYNVKFKTNRYMTEYEDIEINQEKVVFDKTLQYFITVYDEFDVVRNREGHEHDKLDDITRLPISPTDQIQNVYVMNRDMIENLGANSISEVTQNIAGVYTFATYGGVRESMSIRGFRGVPTLKNGILISKDIGGRGFSTDMQGVEAIQIIKGADAINMGASTSYGNAGGVINIVTKTPHFVNRREIGMRLNSFAQIRPTFDIESTLGKKQNVAIRINGAYEHSRTFRNIKDINGESFYINPSLAFRPDNKTEIILEMDHYNTTNAFDVGTVNLSPTNEDNKLYHLPKDRFLGFIGDNTVQKLTTASVRIKRDISPFLYIRGTAYYSGYDTSALLQL